MSFSFFSRTIGSLVLVGMAASALAAPGGDAGQSLRRIGYSVQVGAFSSVVNAERLAGELQKRNVDAFFFRGDKGLMVVRFGDYGSEAQAKDAAQRLVRSGIIGRYYISPPRAAVVSSSPAGAVPAGAASLPDTAVHDAAVPATAAGDETGSVTARTAERFVGLPYKWGGNTVVEGLDCSGFVRAVYNLVGVSIPRTSAEQYKVGRPVERSELKEGDLVFFGKEGKVSHVGIYVGSGSFVHAPSRKELIKVTPLTEPRYLAKYIGARRYF